MNEHRKLNFETLDDVERECRSLLDHGYRPLGKWNLAQTCLHLSDWLRFPMDGYPLAPLPVRLLMGTMRATIGRRQLKKILANGFKPNLPTMPATVYATETSDDAQAVQTFAETIDRFKCHNGAFHPSPLFGHMTPQEVLKLQLRHCEHHLGYLIPDADRASG